ncbi:Fc.00g048990.m01.CDS01 [Cosmosporella sp. VM-42]
MSSDIETRIKQAAPRKDELLQIIQENGSGPNALLIEQQNIDDLQREIAKSNRQIENLNNRRIVQFKDHERYRDSHVKKFMYKATGKQDRFDEKAEEQEHLYLKALEEEQKEQNNNSTLKARIDEARIRRDKAEDMAGKYHTAQNELDSLFNAIFEGPTPEFPEEDEKEQVCNEAQKTCLQSSDMRDKEGKAIKLLEGADKHMSEASSRMRSAQNNSRADMFSNNSLLFDGLERRALSKAQEALEQAKAKVDEARKLSPSTMELPGVNINHRMIMFDIVFDNIISDYKFHQKIKRGREEVENCAVALKNGIAQAKKRQLELQKEVEKCQTALEDAKGGLQKVREKIIERVVNK